MTEQRKWRILKSTHKGLYSSDWPNYLRLETYENNRNLRSSKGIQLQRSMIANTFQDEAANLFNNLPLSLRNCVDPILFFKETKILLQDKARSRIFFSFHCKYQLFTVFNLVFLKFVLIVITLVRY